MEVYRIKGDSSATGAAQSKYTRPVFISAQRTQSTATGVLDLALLCPCPAGPCSLETVSEA